MGLPTRCMAHQADEFGDTNLLVVKPEKGHVWTAPAVQEEFDLSANCSGAAMYAACFSRRGLPRRDAAAVAAGPDVIR